MLFYCPTRFAMGQQFSNSGYRTNYTPNMLAMSMPGSIQDDPWNPGAGTLEPWQGLKRFPDFSYGERIGLLFEQTWHWIKDVSYVGPEYVHNSFCNILFMNGEVKSFKETKRTGALHPLLESGQVLLTDP